jgi:hypothetical protein
MKAVSFKEAVKLSLLKTVYLRAKVLLLHKISLEPLPVPLPISEPTRATVLGTAWAPLKQVGLQTNLLQIVSKKMEFF